MNKFLSLTLAAITCVTIASAQRSQFVAMLPLSHYHFGKSMKAQYILRNKQHDFYVGLNFHVNHDIKKWSNSQNVFNNNGYAHKAIHYFHPNIGYRRHFKYNENFPVRFILFGELQGGRIGLINRFYFNKTRFLSPRLADDVFYFSLVGGVGMNMSITQRISLAGHAGIDMLVRPVREFGYVYTFGLQYKLTK